MVTEVEIKACDVCGKPGKVAEGKTCELGHFLCGECVWGGSLPAPRQYCVLCYTSLTRGV